MAASKRKDDYRQAALTGILSNPIMVVNIDKNKITGDTLEEAIKKKAIEIGDSLEAEA